MMTLLLGFQTINYCSLLTLLTLDTHTHSIGCLSKLLFRFLKLKCIFWETSLRLIYNIVIQERKLLRKFLTKVLVKDVIKDVRIDIVQISKIPK